MMLIRSLFDSPGIKKPGIKKPHTRARRPHTGFRLDLESLENRVPLSSGLSPAIEAVPVWQAVETHFLAVGQALARELSSIEPDQGVTDVPYLAPLIEWTSMSAFTIAGATSSSPPTSPETSPTFLGDLSELLSIAPVSNAFSGPDSTAGTGFTMGPAPTLATELENGAETISVNSASPFLDRGTLDSTTLQATEGRPMPPYFPNGPFDDDNSLSPWMGYLPSRPSSPTSASEDGTDMTFAGTLEDLDTSDASTATMTTPLSNGRASGRAWNFIVAEMFVQLDSSGDTPTSSGLPYLASAQPSGIDFGPSAGAVEDALSWQQDAVEPVLPAAITAGGVSIDILLGGPDVPLRNEPGGVEQVALLVPLPETSLALAATLWTGSSDSPAGKTQWDLASPTRTEPGARPDASSAWALFMSGMDQALEQASRDIRDGIVSDSARTHADEEPGRTSDDLIEWQGPILPAVGARFPVSAQRSSTAGRMSAQNDPGPIVAPQTRDTAQHESGDEPTVVLGTVPVISIVSLSTMIAGWFWRKRQRRKGATSSTVA